MMTVAEDRRLIGQLLHVLLHSPICAPEGVRQALRRERAPTWPSGVERVTIELVLSAWEIERAWPLRPADQLVRTERVLAIVRL